MDQHEREAATQPKRRERDRHRRRMRLSDSVEYSDEVTEMLIDDRVPAEVRSEDPRGVASAISAYLRIQLASRRRYERRL